MLTHCNAGWLATVDWGTALAGVYAAHDAGVPVHVWVDETRPRNQGAALTAWELGAHGVPHTVIVDNAGGHLMQRGQVDVVLVGTDRTTAAGDVVNKIGTYLKALAARDCGVPFYVAAPSPSIDWTIDGAGDTERHPDRGAIAGRGDDRRGHDGRGRRRARAHRAGRQRRAQPGLRRHARAPGHRHRHRARRRARVARGAGAAVPGARRGRRGARGERRARAPRDRRHRALVDGARAVRGDVRQRLGADGGRHADHAERRTVRRRRRRVHRPGDLRRCAAGGRARGRLAPSTEWRIHRDIYRRRPEIGAVVHTHSTFATALSCLRRPIPAFHYMVAKAGGDDIRCARYATYGTAALSRNALAALAGGRRACLLANHGLVALGADLASARLLAEEIEALCAQYIHARAAGTPVVLPAREMTRVRAKFATYGRPGQRE